MTGREMVKVVLDNLSLYSKTYTAVYGALIEQGLEKRAAADQANMMALMAIVDSPTATVWSSGDAEA